MTEVVPDGVQLFLKEPDSVVQAALLGQDPGLGGQQHTIGAQMLFGQLPLQHLPQGLLAPSHVLLQLLSVLLLPQQKPESLQQRSLDPPGEGAVSTAAPGKVLGCRPQAPPSPALPPTSTSFTFSSESLSELALAKARFTRARRLPSSSRRPSTRSRSVMNRRNRSSSRGVQAWLTAASRSP